MKFDIHIQVPERVIELLGSLLTRVDQIHIQGVRLMAKFQELSDELDAIKTAVDAVKVTVAEQVAEIAALKLQAGPVTQEQLDSLDAKADSILASLTPDAPPSM